MNRRKIDGTIEAYGTTWAECEPASSEEIAECEKRLQMALPEDLRKLLMTCAGGYPEHDFYENEEKEFGVGYILPPVGDREVGGVAIVKKELSNAGVDFPAKLIPFAYDNGNANVFCLDAENGQVIYWLGDVPSDRAARVAGSLEEFLTGLTNSP